MSPFDVVADDLLAADGLILGTTENIGYMAGATRTCSTAATTHGWIKPGRCLSASISVPASMTACDQTGIGSHLSRPEVALSPRH